MRPSMLPAVTATAHMLGRGGQGTGTAVGQSRLPGAADGSQDGDGKGQMAGAEPASLGQSPSHPTHLEPYPAGSDLGSSLSPRTEAGQLSMAALGGGASHSLCEVPWLSDTTMCPCHLGNFGGRAPPRFHWGMPDAKPVPSWCIHRDPESPTPCKRAHILTLTACPSHRHIHTLAHSHMLTHMHEHTSTLTHALTLTRTCSHTSHMHTPHTDRPLTYTHAHTLYCTLAHTYYTLTHTFLTPTLSEHHVLSAVSRQ